MRDLPRCRCRCWATSHCCKILARTRCDFPLNPWTANALSCRNHSQGNLPCVDVTQGELRTGNGTGAGAEEPLPELMQKFCFIKFSSQAPNPNTYSYTLQCLTLTESAAAPRGVAKRARGWTRCGWGETKALKSFSFLTRQYFMTSAARGEEWRMVNWGQGEDRFKAVAWAVGRGNTLAHCRIMPLKNSFICCLTFHDKTQLAPPKKKPPSPCPPRPL